MLATFSIVAITIFACSAILVSTLCRIYYNKVQKQKKYQKI